TPEPNTNQANVALESNRTASSYAEAVIAVEFDAITFLSNGYAASYRYRIDNLIILNFLGLTNTHFTRIRNMVTTGSGFIVQQLDGQTHYTMTPDFGADILCPEVGDTLGISTGHIQCFWRRAIVANEVQAVASESVYYYRQNGVDDRASAKSWIAEMILGGSSQFATTKASDYFDRSCSQSNTIQGQSRSYGCLYIDPGYRWVSRLHRHSSAISPFSISDKTIIVAIMTIVTDDGDVIRRRLLTVDNNELLAVDLHDTGQGHHPLKAHVDSDPGRRHLLQTQTDSDQETLSHTVGNSAVQVNNVGVDTALNIAYLNGLENSLWQLLQIETARRPDVPLQTFAINTKKVLLSMSTSLGPFVQSIRPVGFESILLTSTINITLILEMNNSFGNLSTNTLQCVIANLSGEINLLSGELLDVVVQSCLGAGNQTLEQTEILHHVEFI
ncbi:hypothetical protein T484DRAFT_1756951, partial [Baffinella frigidus]